LSLEISLGFFCATLRDTSPLISPETFETIWRECSVSRRILDVSVSQVGLQCTGIVTVIRQLKAAGVAKHSIRSGIALPPYG
jgi:hypothetical protein